MEALWANLECPTCNGVEFMPVVNMRWKPAGGMVVVPSGEYVCVKCATYTGATDGARLIDKAKQELKLKKLKEIGAEIDAI